MTANVNGTKLLKIAELSRLLDVSTRTIWRYIANGRLPQPIRFTKVCVRWNADEVAKAIERLQHVTHRETPPGTRPPVGDLNGRFNFAS